jgi:hypothetical protein
MHLQISTNAHQVEPETRMIRALFEHIAALELELEETREIILSHVEAIAALRESSLARARADAIAEAM